MAEQLENAQTQKYFAERLEFRDAGVMQIPVAVDNNPANVNNLTSVIVRLHQPREFIVVTWSAEKWGEPPRVPSPYDLEPNAVFLDGWRAAEIPILSEDLKGRFWRMRGQYLYAKKVAKGLDVEMQCGVAPFDNYPITYSAIGSEYFGVEPKRIMGQQF